MGDKIYQNDVGHLITVKTYSDFTSVNTVTLEVRLPQSVGSASWVGSQVEVTSGDIIYRVQSGDFSNFGNYEVQAKMWVNANNFQHGCTFNITVLPKWVG